MASDALRDKKYLQVRIITWNVSKMVPSPDTDLSKLFTSTNYALNCDLIIIGLQEVNYAPASYLSDLTFRQEPWSQLFLNYLGKNGYALITCNCGTAPRQMGLITLIFFKRVYCASIRFVETKFVRTGVYGYSSHKGAVCNRVTLSDGIVITFINCHFASDVNALPIRVKEYAMVVDGAKFSTANTISDGYVFWFGDLNFRIEGFMADDVKRLVHSNCFEKLYDFDQLKLCRESMRAFDRFEEGRIKFRPTYKFLIGSNEYDLSRVPSWCDRILWLVEDISGLFSKQLECQLLNYNSDDRFTASDHKPVLADFKIQICGLISTPVVVFLFPSQKNNTLWHCGQNNLCRYFVSSDYTPSFFDWIGVFKQRFVSDQDVVTWMYVISSWPDDEEHLGGSVQNLLFKSLSLPEPGSYLLGYYSRSRCCLMALSEPFQVLDPEEITNEPEVMPND